MRPRPPLLALPTAAAILVAVRRALAARARAEREAVAARLEAEHDSRAKSSFLAAMSHEIRTPMIGVTGMLEVLARSRLTPQQQQMVATAQESAISLLEIVGDILDVSKIEAGRMEIARSTFALRPLLRVTVETFAHTASDKGLLLEWSADERLAAAHVGDPLRVRQVVGNLLSNAVKFTDAGGVELTARLLDARGGVETVEIAVADTGVGVSAEQQRRLFAEFAQAEAATAQRFGGSGLGLVISLHLARLMGGDVTLESEEGRGTTMRFRLPLRAGDPAAIDPAAGRISGNGPATRTKPARADAEREGSVLLLAEDHPVSRTVLRHQLDAIGFHVDVAEDGEQALALFRAARYGLVFTDVEMPGLDGYGLVRAIREHEAGALRTPVIGLSATATPGEREQCLAAGMDDFAGKPTTIAVLAGKLRRWLPALDWTVAGTSTALADLALGDPALTAAVLADFAASSREDLAALEAAIADRDAELARRQAHRIAGASRIVGADEPAALAAELERAVDRDPADWDGIRALLGRVAAALARAADQAGAAAGAERGR